MKRRSFFIIGFLTIACSVWPAAGTGDAVKAGIGSSRLPQRIVSLAPSATEILFELGLGDRVVGVTRYCRYPPEAETKARVGGYVDPNYEGIVRLRPDLTIMLTVHAEAAERLRHLGLAALTVDHARIEGIIASIMTIGNACGALEQARNLAGGISARMERIRNAATGACPPRVMVSVDRTTDALSSVYIAGKNTCYDEMIAIAGGVNAYAGAAAYPAVSAEGILQMNPQVIIDLVPCPDGRKEARGKALAQWNKLNGVEAIQNGRVYLFEQDYAVIPGPRFIILLEDMARAIHPERYVK
ncbi:MAG: ABC transporter substrate-binding protein [Chitinispirillaceae bacterium]|nr:ABC transporter substrate-binding protein [Chitinispirillaceae bacterium]